MTFAQDLGEARFNVGAVFLTAIFYKFLSRQEMSLLQFGVSALKIL